MNRRNFCRTMAAMVGVGGVAAAHLVPAKAQVSGSATADVAQIYQLQAAFHRAKTAQDLELMMSLWDPKATLKVHGDPQSPYLDVCFINTLPVLRVFPGSATLQRGFWSRARARRSQGKGTGTGLTKWTSRHGATARVLAAVGLVQEPAVFTGAVVQDTHRGPHQRSGPIFRVSRCGGLRPADAHYHQ